MTGKGLESLLESMLSDCERLTGNRLAWHRHEPKMAGKIRVSGGLPDYEAVFDGRTHLIECKHESGSAAALGRLTAAKDATGDDKWTGTGVKPDQAREMDRHERAGVRCWILIRLEVNAATLKRAAQQPLMGAGGDLPAVVCRLVPWPEWRARMAAAEDCRRRGQEPQASIPAAELALMGHPLRSAGELLKALEQA
jgi:hypothetical protein